jgi:hypothetical protein
MFGTSKAQVIPSIDMGRRRLTKDGLIRLEKKPTTT